MKLRGHFWELAVELLNRIWSLYEYYINLVSILFKDSYWCLKIVKTEDAKGDKKTNKLINKHDSFQFDIGKMSTHCDHDNAH